MRFFVGRSGPDQLIPKLEFNKYEYGFRQRSPTFGQTTEMAHSPLFEQRIHDALTSEGVCAEPKKMFGGVAFMVNGHMSVGITNKGDFMVRVAPSRHEELSERSGARPMDFTGRPMKGFLFVEPEAVKDQRSMLKWVQLALDHVRTLPPKSAKKKAAKKTTGKK